ncbi:MAG: hypothetical protein FIA99_04565 [Ruminiclostridium sp.]|nr:hypothetical protein [Ruminiclostridium sp.]
MRKNKENQNEPMMIFATADTNFYIPADNLSTANKHYKTLINLCSTIKDTLETVCNLSTACDLQQKNSGGIKPRSFFGDCL